MRFAFFPGLFGFASFTSEGARSSRRQSAVVLALGLVLTAAFAPRLACAQDETSNPTGSSGDFNGEVATGGGYDPFTGNAKRAVTDLTVPGANGVYPLAFTRVFNSRPSFLASDLGYFGDAGNWRHSYQWTVAATSFTPPPSGQPTAYTLAYPDGRDIIFQQNSGASPQSEYASYWRGPAGTTDRLEVAGGGLCLHTSDGGRVNFGAALHPATIVDANGAVTKLDYDPSNSNYLAKVTEPGGRSLTFHYLTTIERPKDGSGYSTKVTWTWLDWVQASTGQKVIYQYTPFGQLDYGANNRVYPTHFYVLTTARYEAEPSTAGNGAVVQAGYGYLDNGYGNLPLLQTALDPHYGGAIVGIRYAYASNAPVGQILEEQNLNTGARVSHLDITHPNAPATVSNETRGDGPARSFRYGENPAATGAKPSLLSSATDFEGNATSRTYTTQADKNTLGKGYLKTSTDTCGAVTSYVTEPILGQVTQVTLPDGRTRSAWWGGSDVSTGPYLLTQTRNERNQYTVYHRHSDTGLVCQIDYPADGGYSYFTYHSFGGNGGAFYKVEYATDQRGARVDYHYDEPPTSAINHGGSGYPGLLTSVTRNHDNAPTETTQLIYDGWDRLIQSIDPRGLREQFYYNARHQLVQIVHLSDVNNPNSSVVYTYDDYGNRTDVQDERGKITHTNYDEYRRVVQVLTPVNDETNGVRSVRSVCFAYDHRDNGNNSTASALSHTSNAWGVSWVYSSKAVQRVYSANNWLTDEYTGMWVEGQGNAPVLPHPGAGSAHQSYHHEQDGQVDVTTDAQGQQWTVTRRDACGRVRTTCDPLARYTPNHSTNWEYFDANEVDNAGVNCAGLLKSVTTSGADAITSPTATTAYLKHDTMGRALKTQNNPSNYPITYASKFNLAGDLTSQGDGAQTQDQGQHITGYTYDQLGRKIKLTHFDTSTETWTYDASGNVASYKNRAGAQQTFRYDDGRNRLTSYSWNDGKTAGVTYEYDAASRLTRVYNGASDVRFTYDDSGMLLTESAQHGGQSMVLTTSYLHDVDGNVTTIVYPKGNTPSFEYDNQQRPTGMYSGGTGLDRVDFSRYNYYGNWLAGRWTLPDLYTSYGYQLNGRVADVWHYHGGRDGTHYSNASIARRAYGYAPDGRLSWSEREADGGQSGSALENGSGDAYFYYPDGSLQAVYRNFFAKNGQWPGRFSATQDGQVDDNNNLTPAGGPANSYHDVYQYDAAGNRTLAVQMNQPQRTYAPDGENRYTDQGYGDGNMNTTDAGVGWGYRYDAENKLMDAATPDGQTAGFAYDGLGRLIAQISGGVYTRFYYAGAQRIEERDSANNPRYQYFFEAPGSDALLFREGGGWGRLWYLRDVAGHTTHVAMEAINAQGKVTGGYVIEQYLYDAYGIPSVYDAGGNARAGGTACDNRYLWHGASAYQWLAPMGLCYCRARFYLPQHGRWLQPDPIGQAGGLNIYAYCGNDPINMVDPSGQNWIGDFFRWIGEGLSSLFGGGSSSSPSGSSPTRSGGVSNDGAGDTPNRIVITGRAIPQPEPVPNNDRSADEVGMELFGRTGNLGSLYGDARRNDEMKSGFWSGFRGILNMATLPLGGVGSAGERIVVKGVAENVVEQGVVKVAEEGGHIVLGLEKAGLESTAARMGGKTLMNDPNWKSTLMNAIANPETKFTVSLDGLSGSSPYSQVMNAVQRGIGSNPGATNWELSQLYQAGRMSDVTFVQAGQVITNPFGL